MKRALPIIITLAIFSTSLFAAPAADLQTNFKSPPDSAKPHTWWHWMNGNISRYGITADLEAMADVGIGGAQIFNVADNGSVNIPAGPAPFMSPQWLDLIEFAAAEADRLGIELCLHNCAGWSSSGGPWITPEHSMQIVVHAETKTTGPAKFNETLPQPKAKMNFYRDIAILAFPTPKDDKFRVSKFEIKTGLKHKYGTDPDLTDTPPQAAIPQEGIIDLTSKTTPEGLLQWQVPQGNWTIMRIGHTTTGKTNHPAPIAGRGLECDKLSRKALDIHWDKGIKPILEKLGPLVGKSLNNILVDSYEVGPNNWTPKMRSEFKKRTGYDLIKFLPTFAGRVVESNQITERFLWDFRRINSDLFEENYFDYFAEKCKRQGLLSSVEPYHGPFECLAVGAKYDIIMGEFWVGGGITYAESVKIAASVAHTNGKKIVGAESFTAQPEKGRWQNHPASMKILGDQAWCVGINRFIFHRYAHQPWTDRLPGMTMGQWGTHFDRTNTWWNQSKPWMAYIARSQYMLQQGRFAADVLFFVGQATPNRGFIAQRLKKLGYDYDAIGNDLIEKLTVKNGLITLPSGIQYKLLVMDETTFMTPKLAKKIEKLVKSGAVVLGPKPKTSPSLVDFPKSQAKLTPIADKLWGKDDNSKPIYKMYGKGRIVSGIRPEKVLKEMGIKPDFQDLSKDIQTTFIHRKTKDADIYFVASSDTVQNATRCSFRITGKKPELWNAETGAIEPAPLWQSQNGRTIVTIPFAPSGSMFVVFREKLDSTENQYVKIESKLTPKTIIKQPKNKLEIIKAQYGIFTNDRPGIFDVAKILSEEIRDNKLRIKASNGLAGDPAPNHVKGMYVEYTYGDKKYTAQTTEGGTLHLPPDNVVTPEGKELKIILASYGVLPKDKTKLTQKTKLAAIDVTEKLAAKVKNARVNLRVSNALAGKDPNPDLIKRIKVTYSLNGKIIDTVVNEGDMLKIPLIQFNPTPIVPRLSTTPEKTTLAVADNGNYTLTKIAGQKNTVVVTNLPNPIDIQGPWQLNFTPGWNTPEKVTLPELISWTDHDIKEIRYYSGTATYQKDFNIPKDFFANDRKIILDLGQVLYLADVTLNGQDLGTLWKEPFHLDITDALKPGTNKLEIAVTNLWPNRLIGDEQYPDDCQWNGNALKAWPEWFLKDQPRPTKERLTFTTWKHWRKDDPLLPSGLIGPVKINAVQVIPITD